MPSVSTFSHPQLAAKSAPVSLPDYVALRCVGEAYLPSRLAVDLAHVLDVDPDVDRWSCRRLPEADWQRSVLIEACRGEAVERLFVGGAGQAWPEGASADGDVVPPGARRVVEADIDPVRLANAKLLLPHAGWRVSLDDRVRLLAVLDEESSVTLGECLSVFRHTSRPIAAVASLALARAVDLDLDTPLGSRTRVIRRPD